MTTDEPSSHPGADPALLAEAQDPSTSPARLTEIAALVRADYTWNASAWGIPPVLGALARNPNTPPEEMAVLLHVWPAEACRNPALPLLVLEAPDLLLQVYEQQKRTVLCLAHAPAPLIALWASSPDASEEVVLGARLHIAVAGEVGPDEDWCRVIFDHWREHVARVTPPVRQNYMELVELGLAPRWIAGTEPWPEPFTEMPPSAQSLTVLPDQAEQEALKIMEEARRRERETGAPLSIKAAFVLTRKLSAEIRTAIARYPDCPPALLHNVANGDAELEYRAATHPDAAPDLLGLLATYRGWPALRRLARRHPNCPAASLASQRRTARDEPGDEYQSHLDPLLTFLRLLKPEMTHDLQQRSAAGTLVFHYRLAAVCTLPPGDPVLARLAEDGNRLIRAAARARQRGETFAWPPDAGEFDL